MRPASLVRCSTSLAAFCAALILAPVAAVAAAQTSPIQGTNPETAPVAPAAAAYVPTSLVAEPGLPRTPDGHPDFQGVVWQANFFGPLETVSMIMPPQLVISEDKAKAAIDRFLNMMMNMPGAKAALEADPEAAALFTGTDGLPIVRGERRTRLTVLPADGKVPMAPEARRDATKLMGGAAALKANNPEERTNMERCLTMGGAAPQSMMSPLHPRQFMQTPGHIVLNTEYGDEARIIPIAAQRRPVLGRRPLGDSIARWEGDTLVIETMYFPVNDRLRIGFPSGLLLGPDSKVTERYTRLSKDELLYQFTIEDPKIYSAPWLAEYSFFRAPFRMYPSSCHEENYSLPNILSGQRVADVRRVEAFKPSDANGDGRLDKAEYAVLLKTLGFASQLETLFPQRDVNKDGFVSAEEYSESLP